MDPRPEKKCSWCKSSQPNQFKLNHPLLCDPCLPKFYKQDRRSSSNIVSFENHFAFDNSFLDHFNHQPNGEPVFPKETKAMEIEVFDSHDRLFCSCLTMGRFLGHQIVTVEKIPLKEASNASSNAVEIKGSSFSEILDEEFQEKKDQLYKELDHGFEAFFQKLKQFAEMLKKQMELTEQEKEAFLKANINDLAIGMMGREERVLKCISYLCKELENGLHEVKHWIVEIREKALHKQIKELKFVFNTQDFEDFLYCICQLEATDHLLSQKIANEEQQEAENVQPVAVRNDDIANQRSQALVQQYEEEEGESEEDILKAIAMHFTIKRSWTVVEFEQLKKRTTFVNNYKLASTHSLYNTEKLKIIIYSSRVTKTTKTCLDYIFSKGYFPKVEIIVRVDRIRDTCSSKFINLFSGLSKLRTLSNLSLEVVDFEQATLVLDESSSLLAFIQGGLPKGITKKLILGSLVSSISACIADTLPKSRSLEWLNLAFKAYDIDNNQLRNVGAEWSTLTKIQNLSLMLSQCGMITSTGIADFLESIKQNGSELSEVNLDIEDCRLVQESELDHVIKGCGNASVMV